MSSFLCFDFGQFPELCNALAAKGKNKVYYYTSWPSAYPKYQDYVTGKNFEYLIKVEEFMDFVDLAKKVDVIVFPDVYNNGLAALLRESGLKVFGSGRGEILENQRGKLKKILKTVGLQVKPWTEIKGVHALKDYLLKNPDKFVKIDRYRGDLESFHAKDMDAVTLLIDELETVYGPFQDDFKFIVEDPIHTDLEYGVDTFFDGNDYVKPFSLGIEFQKSCYIGHFVDTLPAPLQETMDKMKVALRKMDYRGPLSTEEKIVSLKEHYLLDWCSRFFSPGSLLYTEAIRNFPEVVKAVANKQHTRLDVKEKYWGAVPFTSERAMAGKWVKLNVDPRFRGNVKFYKVASAGGKYYAVKGQDENVVFVIVAGGNSVDEVIKKLKYYADKADCMGINKDVIGDLDIIKEIIAKGTKAGIIF